MNSLPEEEKDILAKYTSDWASHFDQQKNELESKYALYADLGDPEEIKLAKTIYQNVLEQPEKVLEILQAELNQKKEAEAKKEAPFAELPPEFASEFKKLQETVLPVVGYVTEQQKREQEAANIQAIDNLLADLTAKHGEYDKEYVLGQMIAGKTPDQAIEAYKAFENRVKASANKDRLPNVQLSGSGTITQEKKPATANERKALLAQILETANSDR